MDRAPDGTTRAAWWGVLALLAAQAEVTTAVRIAEEQVVVVDTVGEVVTDVRAVG